VGGLTLVLDYVAEVAPAAAAAGCLQEVPGVDILMDIVGAWKVTKLINKIHELSTVWSRVWAGLQGMMAGIMTMVGLFENYTAAAKLPSAGYANAAEGQLPAKGNTTSGRPGPS
jgi:hypothetical protein